MSNEIHERLRNECATALQTLEKLNQTKTTELQSKLAWCIGSFDYDRNPAGLHEYGTVALEMLKNFKENNPRKVTRKMIDSLEAGIRNYEASLS